MPERLPAIRWSGCQRTPAGRQTSPPMNRAWPPGLRRACRPSSPGVPPTMPIPACAWAYRCPRRGQTAPGPARAAHDVLRTAPPPALQAVLEGDVVQDWQRPCRHCRTSPRRAYSERSPGSTSLDCTMCTRARTSICCGGSIPPRRPTPGCKAAGMGNAIRPTGRWRTVPGRRRRRELAGIRGRSREVLVKRPAGAALELRESYSPPPVSA